MDFDISTATGDNSSNGVVPLSFSGWKGQRLVDIQATQAAIFHASKASRADGSELFARRGDGTELKSNCGSLGAWRPTVATCLVIGGLAW
ncbi:hypothetical protein, partial [Rhizobium leguminosarum]|uniref:hypothetical protein n=1 Tax=Rhizobium leguminosarum TaxID=384 RepID=UPI001C90A13F